MDDQGERTPERRTSDVQFHWERERLDEYYRVPVVAYFASQLAHRQTRRRGATCSLRGRLTRRTPIARNDPAAGRRAG